MVSTGLTRARRSQAALGTTAVERLCGFSVPVLGEQTRRMESEDDSGKGRKGGLPEKILASTDNPASIHLIR
jgi:hypothetical protein